MCGLLEVILCFQTCHAIREAIQRGTSTVKIESTSVFVEETLFWLEMYCDTAMHTWPCTKQRKTTCF